MSMDHDLLIEINTDVKHIKAGMDSHIIEDKKIQGELRKDISAISVKMAWYAGGLAALAFIFKEVWK